MNKKDYKIHIIGAGVSGLVAASVLESNGYSPVVIEATDRVGGRVKTDMVDGYQLDHGFQVLLTSYPAAQQYLDYDALELQRFLPGAAIFKKGKPVIIGDPLKDMSLLFSTLFSGIGGFTDKLKILKLNTVLQKKSIAEIFTTKEQTTRSYLQDYDFSEAMIADFFKPFFSGIFLETELDTSSRMFEFVYKMFGSGDAALPKAGIEAIPIQLKQKLKNTTFHFNTKVKSIKDSEVALEDGTVLESDFILVATEASKLIANTSSQTTEWKSCDTLYFETEHRVIRKPLIGLLPAEGTLINNIFYHTSVQTANKASKELLSVTIVDNHNLTSEALILHVQGELEEYFGITSATFIKQYTIPQALPKLASLHYEMAPSETHLTNTIFIAGDTQLNGSLNAAMISGERAALGMVEAMSKTIL